MRALLHRRLLVAGLILAAGLVGAVAAGPDPAPPGLPAAGALTAGTDWRPASATPPVALAVRSRQWLLDDRAGDQALLYVGVTAQPRALLDWTGELGYQGDGYIVVVRQDGWLRLGDGRLAAVDDATVGHLAERRLLRSAIVGPTGVVRRGWDLLLPAAWDLVRDRSDVYFVVRVAVADAPGAGARADGVLAAALDRLLAISDQR
jgi:hypothetical protein